MSGVVVIIVNYRGARLVADCVASLAGEGVARVVVVDNSEDAGELAALAGIGAPFPVEVVDAGSNLGFGAAVNLGVRVAAPDPDEHLWVLNPDTVVVPGCVAALQRVLEDEDLAVVSPLITHDDEPATYWYRGGRFDPRSGRVEHEAIGEPALGPEPPEREVSFMTGAALMLSTRTWESLGGFRDDLFLYWEDVDLSIRARHLGVRLVVCGDAVVRHRVGAGSSGGSAAASGMSAVFYYYNARNRVRVMRETFGARSLTTAPALLESARLLARPLRRELGRGALAKARSGLRGLVAGLRERPEAVHV